MENQQEDHFLGGAFGWDGCSQQQKKQRNAVGEVGFYKVVRLMIRVHFKLVSVLSHAASLMTCSSGVSTMGATPP
jgi:hypothetical protein